MMPAPSLYACRLASMHARPLAADSVPVAIWIVRERGGAWHAAWPDFVAANGDVADEILAQFREFGEAEIGGGGAPLFRMFPVGAVA
jgi:hypothetical protein